MDLGNGEKEKKSLNHKKLKIKDRKFVLQKPPKTLFLLLVST